MTELSSITPDLDTAPTMQEVILRLQGFWAARGTLIGQPFNTEVGAGTGNPATAMRVLGPEPWRVAYVEPSVRPDDARYGENPNRLQTHTQFQVILKPAPSDPQEVYLESLAALGINTAAHDVRFIEDNWASPALGAWGLGWEVWLDGLEITQFTYFQQAGGLPLDPISVELTYGLERIVMAVQGKRHFTEIRYNDTLTYGDVYLQSEYEMSRYYLDEADIERTRRLFADYAAEAEQMLDAKLPVPAYSYVLKCSHAFNVLDARGAVSTTERARSFGLMRRLTRDSSRLWVARREELGFPLGTPAPAPIVDPRSLPEVTGAQPLLIEIGVEELPHRDVLGASAQVHAAVKGVLDATSLDHGPVVVKATPRRVVVTVAALAAAEADTRRSVKGPRAVAARDAAGKPTKALLGFLRGQQAELSDVIEIDVDGVPYVAVDRFVPGRTSPGVVAAAAQAAVRAMHAERNMRWGDPELSYSRPVRWLVVLLGGQHVPVAVSHLVSGTSTRLLRGASQPTLEVTHAEGYEDLLLEHGIVLDRDVRRERVLAQAQRVAAEAGGRIDADAEAGLLDEIADIVEDPRVVLGTFEERFLDLPAPVLTTVMRKHQRYLPVLDESGRLLPRFVTFANGPCDVDLVRSGNESVIRARYEDASFFWRADLQTSPEEFRTRLATLTFEERLGSFDDRVNRIAHLADRFAVDSGLSDEERATVTRAAALGKFDLATQMVVELSSLAGTMARVYAEHAGEPPAVAQALAEMEMPRSSASPVAESRAGAVLALADRIDLLTSMYAIGAIPTGTSDPYGVRRAALGITRTLRAFPELNGPGVRAAVAAAAERLAAAGVTATVEIQAQAQAFVVQRFEQQLLDEGCPHTRVRAVLPLADRPALADRQLERLHMIVTDPRWPALVGVLQRAQRILPAGTPVASPTPDTIDALAPAERDLVDAVARTEAAVAGRPDDLNALLAASAGLPETVEAFFDTVHVMDDDPAVRGRRLGLLARLAALGGDLDWSAL